jgi:CelD/BcsL family acetyltransferase involved in cellulose biosynthesis
MRARVLPDEFGRLAPEWDALADEVDASPFLRPGWFAAWWNAFGTGQLRLLVERDAAGRLLAVMPVSVRHGVCVAPANWHSPEYGILAAGRAARTALLDRLFASRPQLVSLRLLPTGDETIESVHAAADRFQYHSALRSQPSCPVVGVDGDWDTYERGLSRNLRQDLARCRRRLAELGPVSLEVSLAASDLEAAFELEQLGWKGARGSAMASRPQTRQFYEAVARWAETRGWLRLIFLRAGERRVAFHLALEQGGSYIPLKGGLDPDLSRCSPGKLMIHATLERAFATGLRRYDFVVGSEEYKLRWATGLSDRVHFCAFAPTLRGASLRVADLRARPLARRAVTAARRVRAV